MAASVGFSLKEGGKIIFPIAMRTYKHDLGEETRC